MLVRLEKLHQYVSQPSLSRSKRLRELLQQQPVQVFNTWRGPVSEINNASTVEHMLRPFALSNMIFPQRSFYKLIPLARRRTRILFPVRNHTLYGRSFPPMPKSVTRAGTCIQYRQPFVPELLWNMPSIGISINSP
jgi:hypothetical protein